MFKGLAFDLDSETHSWSICTAFLGRETRLSRSLTVQPMNAVALSVPPLHSCYTGPSLGITMAIWNTILHGADQFGAALLTTMQDITDLV